MAVTFDMNNELNQYAGPDGPGGWKVLPDGRLDDGNLGRDRFVGSDNNVWMKFAGGPNKYSDQAGVSGQAVQDPNLGWLLPESAWNKYSSAHPDDSSFLDKWGFALTSAGFGGLAAGAAMGAGGAVGATGAEAGGLAGAAGGAGEMGTFMNGLGTSMMAPQTAGGVSFLPANVLSPAGAAARGALSFGLNEGMGAGDFGGGDFSGASSGMSGGGETGAFDMGQFTSQDVGLGSQGSFMDSMFSPQSAMRSAGSQLFSGRGSNGGMNLADMLAIGSGIYGLTEAQKLKRLAQQASERADPFAAMRPGYQDRLRALEADPNSISKTPGYAAGLQAVERRMLAQGYQGSGNMMTSLQKYGGDFFNNERNFLAQGAGIGINPGTGAQLLLSGNEAGTTLAGKSLASLGYGLGGRSMADQLMMQMLMRGNS